MERPRVSVVVASYNYEDLVVETLESLVAQTCRDFEIVVVDDGSKDGSVANIRRFIDGHASCGVPVRLLTHPDGGNHGLPATVELGVRESRGEYVAFCESDDLWTPDHLEKVLAAVDASGGRARIVVNDVEIFGDPGRCERFRRIRVNRRSVFRKPVNRISPAKFRDTNWILTFSCTMVARDVLLACDFAPVGRAAALDWWLWRQVCYDHPVHYVDLPLTRWRMHASYMVSDQAAASFEERQLKFVAACSALLRRQHPVTSRWRLVRGTSGRVSTTAGLRKWLRGVVKRLLPYGVQRAYAFQTYGIFFPTCGTWPGILGKIQKCVVAALPFGFVCWAWKFDPDRGVASGNQHGVQPRRLLEPSYRIPFRKRRQIERERRLGLEEYAETIRRHGSARIAVVLHLFYDKAWPALARYLRNLEPYGYDLYVTYTEGRISERTRKAVAAFRPGTVVLPCENRGFDLWPFLKVLNQYDLPSYDIVFKLHSKGTGRPFLFMYGQIFKYADWFYNLFDGVLGGRAVHQVVKALLEDGALLAAAANLIVPDPRHKRNFVRAYCARRGIPFAEDYRYVAGTVFAVRGEALKPVRDLKLTEADFAPSARGDFSAAHAVERAICFPMQGRMAGIEVGRNEYPLEAEECASMSALRMLDDPRFELDDEFFYRSLETRMVAGYEVVRVKLGDIRRRRYDGTVCTLAECEPFGYLKGDVDAYADYCRSNREVSGYAMSQERFERLRDDMAEFNPRFMPVLRRDGNTLMDGQHRCCILLDKYGPDHEIEVVRTW